MIYESKEIYLKAAKSVYFYRSLSFHLSYSYFQLKRIDTKSFFTNKNGINELINLQIIYKTFKDSFIKKFFGLNILG